MNRRFLIFALVAAVLSVFAWWYVNRLSPKRVPQAETTSARAPSAPPPAASFALTAQASYQVPAGGAYEGLSDPRWQWWNTMRKVDRSFEWKIPIRFYGKVVDQHDLPVAEAAVRYGWNDVEGSHEQHTRSDANGQIVIDGLHGKILSVDVSKDGYHSSTSGPHSFEYAAFFEADYHRPDSENPVTFRLVKKLAQEPLIARHVSERVPYDQVSYYDLERGRLSSELPGGLALKFSFERGESPQGQPFNWEARVEAVNGGLQETKEEFAHLAPETGYVAAREISHTINEQPFRGSAQMRLYVRTADKYARVDINVVHPNSRSLGPRLSINSFLNPAGSRNLEPGVAAQTSTRNGPL